MCHASPGGGVARGLQGSWRAAPPFSGPRTGARCSVEDALVGIPLSSSSEVGDVVRGSRPCRGRPLCVLPERVRSCECERGSANGTRRCKLVVRRGAHRTSFRARTFAARAGEGSTPWRAVSMTRGGVPHSGCPHREPRSSESLGERLSTFTSTNSTRVARDLGRDLTDAPSPGSAWGSTTNCCVGISSHSRPGRVCSSQSAGRRAYCCDSVFARTPGPILKSSVSTPRGNPSALGAWGTADHGKRDLDAAANLAWRRRSRSERARP